MGNSLCFTIRLLIFEAWIMWNYCEGSFLSGCMTVVSRLPMTNHLPVKEFEGDVGPVFSRHVGLSQTCRPPTGATLSFPSGCRVHWARRKPVDYGRWTPMNILWKDMICTLHLTLVHGFSMVLASFWGHVSCWCLLRFAKYPFPELRGWKHPEWPAPILGGCLRTARIIYIPHLHISTCGMPSEKLWRFECHECPAVRVEPWPLFRAVLEVIKRGLSIPVTPRPFFLDGMTASSSQSWMGEIAPGIIPKVWMILREHFGNHSLNRQMLEDMEVFEGSSSNMVNPWG